MGDIQLELYIKPATLCKGFLKTSSILKWFLLNLFIENQKEMSENDLALFSRIKKKSLYYAHWVSFTSFNGFRIMVVPKYRRKRGPILNCHLLACNLNQWPTGGNSNWRKEILYFWKSKLILCQILAAFFSNDYN